MAKWLVTLTVLLAIPSVVMGACPNKCSGHGKCGLNDVCQCMQNWIGGDCSGRQCPFTRAWHDTAQRKDDAHYYAECGNRGTCDRTSGECSCDPGFVGSGCRRMQCPNDCSGHGTCEYIEELASNDYNKRVGGKSGTTYEVWDQEKIMGCVCDGGYEGHDCSLRSCPKGDDPLTPNQVDMVQAIVIDQAGGSGYLTYHDPYGNSYTTDKITFDTTANVKATCDSIQVALRRLPNNVLNGVMVSLSASFNSFTRTNIADPSGAGQLNTVLNNAIAGAPGLVITATPSKTVCLVEFKSGPGTTGYQNLLECNVALHTATGQHPVSGRSTDTCKVYEAAPGIDIPTVTDNTPSPAVVSYVPMVSTSGYRLLTEQTECSGRGTCDYSTGTCSCFAGHMGLACQSQEALV
ncbi:hypothetical protein DVH05_000109 [Phytophthora capsici]|nr:hypothetical protein DVH05_000109 [Phytophthora capsici]